MSNLTPAPGATPGGSEPRTLFDQRVPMRDGVTLSADLTLPPGATEGRRLPAILQRTPYLKASMPTYEIARFFAGRGYVFVAVDVRGRGDSEGEWVPYVNDGRDGFDAIEWMATQPWSNGRVGTRGGSYLGRIQWLTALEQPPHLGAMVVAVPPSDPFVETPTGLPSPIHLCWEHYVSGRVLQPMEAVNWSAVYEHLPLMTMDEAAGRLIRHWREDIAHPQLDEYWDRICYQNRFERVNVPVLHVSGWFDDEQVGTPRNFAGMVASGAPAVRDRQRLLMGPWGHAINTTQKLGDVDFGPQALIDLRGEEARWFDRWLKDDEDSASGPVRIFVMGDNVWRDEREWPLARTQWTPYYLSSGGRANSRFGDGALSAAAPGPDVPPDTYRYDPARPVPFITEPTSSQIGGPDDYAAVLRRDDVLVYASEPLAADTEVTGPVAVELYAASSTPDTDFMAMLLDVHPNGFAQRLCDGMVRARFHEGMDRPSLIEPGSTYQYRIDCWHTAQVFKAGHRIALTITSSAFPKFDRNLNTGAPLGQTSEMAVAEQTILHDAAHPSAVILPIIPRE
ncbi:MAG TPA: CocE/NonD family hydrolase [Ktedonobacterales bacterium]|nr:CocE/NonD family hydrolase [Ktedonobacterales bacterium]